MAKLFWDRGNGWDPEKAAGILTMVPQALFLTYQAVEHLLECSNLDERAKSTP